MKKARFYIRGKPLLGLQVSPSWACGGTGGARDGAEPHMVQDVGYRPCIMKEIIKREGLNGIADNYKYSQALTFEQLGKGIPILKEIYRSIEGTNENIKGMSTRIEGMNENIEGMSTRIVGMDENIKGMREEMWEGFDKLPERIAKELKNFLSENPFASQKPLRKIRFAERTFTKKG